MTRYTRLLRLRGLALALVLPAAIGFAQSAPSSSPAPDAPDDNAPAPPVEETSAIPLQLSPVTVLGSHIPSVDVAGIAPVMTLSSSYIQASGFMTTSDLLNSLAQIYAGAGAGRGSVPNMNNPASGTTNFSFDFSTYAPAFGQSGVSGASLGGLGSSDTLILIDGRRTAGFPIGNETNPTNASFVDVNTIPVAMIDHIEVLSGGASAIYGADAVGGVINIVLKKDFNGSELSSSFKTSQHGGGAEYDGTLTTGVAKGKLNAMVMFDYTKEWGLKASQRPFSSSADHLDQGGSDLRLSYGFPATVESVGAGFFGPPPLNGVTDANGNPVTIAFVPAGQNGTALTPSQFVGLTTPAGEYYPYTYNPRTFDPAPYLSIITPAENWATRAHIGYDVSDTLQVFAEATFSRTTSDFTLTPPSFAPGGGFSFGPSITVPASDPDNPFGQDVTVAMTDLNFGPREQNVRTDAYTFVAGANGKVADTWNWNASLQYVVNESHEYQTDLDINKINASFDNADASERYNPFVGEYSATNAALYPSLTDVEATIGFGSEVDALLGFDGQPFDLPGGKLGVAGGVDFRHDLDSSTTDNLAYYDNEPYSFGEANTYHIYGELAVPIFGKPNRLPGFERLDLQLAGSYDGSGPYRRATPQIGVVWQPVEAIMVRGRYSQGFDPPTLTQYEQATIINQPGYNSVIDPERGGETNSSYTEEQGSDQNVQPETSDTYSLGATLKPPFIPGLSLSADYSITTQRNLITASLSDQDIVDNEAAWPSRVVRGPVPAGDPYSVGPITFIDDRIANFGEEKSSDILYTVSYIIPWRRLGDFALATTVVRTLTFEQYLEPGVPFQSQLGDT
ncbi:MAG: TonB-dependent receptor plug domain-containing protein, partial [Opitutaceae bacterium]